MNSGRVELLLFLNLLFTALNDIYSEIFLYLYIVEGLVLSYIVT